MLWVTEEGSADSTCEGQEARNELIFKLSQHIVGRFYWGLIVVVGEGVFSGQRK